MLHRQEYCIWWMSIVDMIKNECVSEKVGLTLIVEMMVESRFRWFGPVWRRPLECLLKRVNKIEGCQ